MEKARDKASRRDERKDSRVPVDRAGGDPDLDGIVPGPQALPYEALDGDITGDEIVKAALGVGDEEEEEEAS